MTEKRHTRLPSTNGSVRTLVSSIASAPQPMPMLPAAMDSARSILPSLERLCSMKRVVSLTDHQAETWLAVLSVYDPAVVNRAALEIGLSADPFPDLGKLVMVCERMRRDDASTIPQDGIKKLSGKMLAKVAEALQLRIE